MKQMKTNLEMLKYQGKFIYKGSDFNIIEKMGITDLASVGITFYSSEVTEYDYYNYNSMSRPKKWKSYKVPYRGVITSCSNFIMHSDNVKKISVFRKL